MSGTAYTGPEDAGSGWPAPAPGMTMGQMLDRVFRLIRTHLRMYVTMAMVPAGTALGALVVLGVMVLLAIFPHLGSKPDPADFLGLLWLAPIAVLLYAGVFVVFAMYMAASSFAVVRTNRGEPVTGAEAWAMARRDAGRYIWLAFLLVLILAGPLYIVLGIAGALFAEMALASAHGGQPALVMFAFFPLFMPLNLALQVYMVLMFLRYGLAIPASAMEGLGAVESLKRSVALTRGGRGRFFVVMLVMYAASFAVIMACEIVLALVVGIGVLGAALAGVTAHSPVLLFFLVPAGVVVVLVVLMIVIALPYVGYSTAIGVVYSDQRWRLENAAATPEGGT